MNTGCLMVKNSVFSQKKDQLTHWAKTEKPEYIGVLLPLDSLNVHLHIFSLITYPVSSIWVSLTCWNDFLHQEVDHLIFSLGNKINLTPWLETRSKKVCHLKQFEVTIQTLLVQRHWRIHNAFIMQETTFTFSLAEIPTRVSPPTRYAT